MKKKNFSKFIGVKIIRALSLVVMIIMLILALKYQDTSTKSFLVGAGIFFAGMVAYVISTMLVSLEPVTKKHIASKKVLEHFGAWDDLDE